ncbi:MAG: DUF3179 domain-containing (seleno)protein [Flavobacteriales bacterium]
MRPWLFFLGILLLLVPEILRVYYIMPFPGSQEDMPTDDSQVNIAYWLHNNIWWVRLVGLAVLLGPFLHYMRSGNWWKRIAVIIPAALCALVFYAFNYKFMADKMFYPPKSKVTSPPGPLSQREGGRLVISVERNGDARAYPIELIGYHHQVLDTVGGAPVMVTYCTVCRTGRAWKPEVDGKPETFRLVGMDHFNAMFEDSRTKSWWRQVSGECIVGPLKGHQLEEVPSAQLTLGEFARLHPQGLVFQPDTNFTDQYAGLEGFDDGSIDSELEYRDTASWQMKSWVVGVVHKGHARAYDWNDLQRLDTVRDTLGGREILILAPEQWNFHAEAVMAIDTVITENLLTGDMVVVVQETRDTIPAYQEFWHSWRTFHPNTTRYEPKM